MARTQMPFINWNPKQNAYIYEIKKIVSSDGSMYVSFNESENFPTPVGIRLVVLAMLWWMATFQTHIASSVPSTIHVLNFKNKYHSFPCWNSKDDPLDAQPQHCLHTENAILAATVFGRKFWNHPLQTYPLNLNISGKRVIFRPAIRYQIWHNANMHHRKDAAM